MVLLTKQRGHVCSCYLCTNFFVLFFSFFMFVCLFICFFLVENFYVYFLEFNNCVCKFDKNKNKNLLKNKTKNKYVSTRCICFHQAVGCIGTEAIVRRCSIKKICLKNHRKRRVPVSLFK